MPMTDRTAPTTAEQAKEAARDDLSRSELMNMVYDQPTVVEVFCDGQDDDYRPTTVTVGFRDSGGRGTHTVGTIFQRAGWTFHDATPCYDRLTFEKPGSCPANDGGDR